MNNHPIEFLIEEHNIISRVEDLIPRLRECRKDHSEEYEKAIRSLLIFFREYADNYHHSKEEQVLFPKMNNHPDFSQFELLTELEEHHDLFRERLSSIEDFLHQQNYEKVQNTLEKYLEELLDHIGVENDELFEIAKMIFNDYELENIYFSCKDIDRNLGENKKQKLINILDDIEVSISYSLN